MLKWTGRIAVALAMVAFIGAGAARAQMIEASGGWQDVTGSDFDGIGSGIGGSASVLFPVSSVVLGAGAGYFSHSIDNFDPNLKLLSIVGVIRYPFATQGSVKPFVGAQGGWIQDKVSSGGSTAKANGFLAGGEVGIQYAVSPMINLLLAGYYNYLNFGDTKVDGTTISDSKATGGAFGLRGGFNVNLKK